MLDTLWLFSLRKRIRRDLREKATFKVVRDDLVLKKGGGVIGCIVQWIILRNHPLPPFIAKVEFSLKSHLIIEYFFSFLSKQQISLKHKLIMGLNRKKGLVKQERFDRFFISNRALLSSILSPFKADDHCVFEKKWVCFSLENGE